MFDKFPYTNFHELNLDYFINKFNEIFTEWEQLNSTMLAWKAATDASNTLWKTSVENELAAWKTATEADLNARETALRAELSAWKTATEADIETWETDTLAALNTWKATAEATFETIRVQAAASATAAQTAQTAAETAQTEAETAQTAAETAAASVSASAAQIATNTGDIADLKTQFDEKVNDKYTLFNPSNWYNPNDFTTGILTANGSTYVSTTSKYTNYYIPVTAGDIIRFNRGDNFQPLEFTHIIAYDADKNLLGSSYGIDANRQNFTILEDTHFVRVTVPIYNNMSTLKPMITIGSSAPTEYSAYFNPYEKITSDFVTAETAEKISRINGLSESVGDLIEKTEENDSVLADTVYHEKSYNLFDGEILNGYITNTGTTGGSSTHKHTNKIDVHELIGKTLKAYNNETMVDMRFICVYDENNNVLSSLGSANPTSEFLIREGCYYVVISTGLSYITSKYFLITTDEEKTIYIPHVNKWEVKKYEAVSGAINIPTPVRLRSESLASGKKITGRANSIKRLGSYAFYCKPGSLTDDNYIVMGKNGGNGYAVGVSASKWAWFINDVYQGGGEHNLTIKDYLFVTVDKIPGTGAVLTIYTNGGKYTRTNTSWTDEHGAPYVYNMSDDTITDVKMSWTASSLRNRYWFFGDSYFSIASTRWPKYVYDWGFGENIMLNAYPGENSANGYQDLIECLEYGKPSAIAWCLGMNDPDDETINTSWLKHAQAFLDVCSLYKIEPILATIPCCPSTNHQYKNEWVRNSGHRYIDFANAVNVSLNSGTWYDDMLDYSDTPPIHPTAQGAIALATQVLTDFPEIMIK